MEQDLELWFLQSSARGLERGGCLRLLIHTIWHDTNTELPLSFEFPASGFEAPNGALCEKFSSSFPSLFGGKRKLQDAIEQQILGFYNSVFLVAL